MRIAYIGPTPSTGGAGVDGAAWITLRQLSLLGVEIDAFLVLPGLSSLSDLDALSSLEGLKVHKFYTGWNWNQWYSRHRVSQVITGQMATAKERYRIPKSIANEHRRRDFDLIYQYSTIETFGMSRYKDELPPLVLHPSTSAAGELRWLRNERLLAEHCNGYSRSAAIRSWVTVRTEKQKHDVNNAIAVLGIRRAFARAI